MQPDAMAPTIVAMCATHIDSERRWLLLQRMIASVQAQTHAVRLYISASCAQERRHHLQELVRMADGQSLVVLAQDQHCSQFEHYQHIVRHLLPSLEDIWCLFTDDDDFSHPERAAVFHQALATMDLRSTDYAIGSVRALLVLPDVGGVASAKDAAPGRDGAALINGLEYVTYLTRATFLRRFCQTCGGALRSPMCDVLLSSTLWQCCRTNIYPDHWLYAYTRALGPSRASRGAGANSLAAYKRVFPECLMDRLSADFGFSWMAGNKWYAPVFSNDWPHDKHRRPWRTILVVAHVAVASTCFLLGRAAGR